MMENEEIKNEVEETTEVTEPVVEEVAETTEVVKENVVNKQPKKSNGKTFAIIGVVVVALAAIIYFGYKKFFNPKQLFINTINKTYEQLENVLDDTSNTNKLSNDKPSIVSEDISVNLNVDKSLLDDNTSKVIAELNKLKVSAKVGVDPKKSEGLVNINALYDNESLIDFSSYLKDNKAYIELKNLYSNLIEVPLDESASMTNQTKVNYNKEDLKYVIRTTKDVYLKNLNDKKFQKSKATIKIDGKEVKVTKINYSVNEEEFTKLSKAAFKELKNDKKYIEALSKISGEDENEIKDSIQEMLDAEEDDYDDDTTITFNTYFKGIKHENVGFDFVIKGEDSSTTIAYYKNADIEEFSIIGDDEFKLDAKITDKKIKIDIKANNQELNINIDKKIEKNKKTYDYTISSQGVSLKGSVVIDVKTDTEDKYESTITASVSMMGMVEAKFTVDLKAETVDKLEFPLLTNSISYDKLTENDLNTIMNKLMQNKGFQKLMTNFGGNNLTY